MEPAPEPFKVLERSFELGLRPIDPFAGCGCGSCHPRPPQDRSQVFEPALRAVMQATPESLALFVSRLQDAAARRMQLEEPNPNLCLKPCVGGRQLGRRRHGLEQPGVVQYRWVVDERSNEMIIALDPGHRSIRGVVGKSERAAV